MKITPIKTRVLQPPQDDLLAVLSSVPLKNKEILVIATKVISIYQGRCIKIDETRKDKQKAELILNEADEIVSLAATTNLKQSPLTKKYGIVVGSAGIDESNGNGYFILWPNDPKAFAKYLYHWFKEQAGLNELGVLIVDTIKRPFRRGAIGMAVAYYGFKALRSYQGKTDIFGRRFKNEQVNIADALSAGAVSVMGEGNEQTPLAIISDLNNLEFFEGADELVVENSDDYFSGLIDSSKWEKGNK